MGAVNIGDSRVLESREVAGGMAIRRRRETADGRRFTTYERIEKPNLAVLKKSGRRELYTSQLVSFSSQKKRLSKLSAPLKTLCMRWENLKCRQSRLVMRFWTLWLIVMRWRMFDLPACIMILRHWTNLRKF